MVKRLRARPSNTLILAFGLAGLLILATFVGLNRPLPSYLVALSNLPPGIQLSESNSKVVELDLRELALLYATPSDALGLTLQQPLAAGELVPRRVLGNADIGSRTAIRFTPNLKPANPISIGSRVAIWQVVKLNETFESQLLVGSATISDISQVEGLFAGELPEVEVLISEPEAALLIESVSSGSAIYILPRP